MLKHKATYEIIAPEDIGYERSNEAGIVLGKLRYCCVSLWKIFICISHSSCISTSLVPTKRKIILLCPPNFVSILRLWWISSFQVL